MTNMEPNKGEIVMYQPDETIRLEVRMDGETVWLSANQMANLFDRDEKTIRKHINNVFSEEEVPKDINTHFLRVDGVKQPSATIYTRQLSQQQQLDLQRHNQQYPPVAVNFCQRNHDRFLIIDDAVYIFGASLKDAGKKLFAYIRMQGTSPTELLSNIR